MKELNYRCNSLLIIMASLLPMQMSEASNCEEPFQKTGKTHEQLKEDANKCLQKCEKILQLSSGDFPKIQAGELTDEKADQKVGLMLSDVVGIDSNLYMFRLLLLLRNRFQNGLCKIHADGSFEKNQSSLERLCDFAIYKCAWNIANSKELHSAQALALIKSEWKPVGMSSLLLHRCELRQQHKPDKGWL